MKIYLYEYSEGEFTVKPIEVKETEKLYKIPCGKTYTQVRKEDIGVVAGSYYCRSASTYLVERDDKKVKDLFFRYFSKRISSRVEEKKEIDKEISDFAEAQDKLLKTSIKEKEADNE